MLRLLVFESLQDRAFDGRTCTAAGSCQSLQGSPHVREIVYLCVDICDLRSRERSDIGAAPSAIDAQIQQFPDFLQRESEVLRASNEAHSPDGVL